MSNRPVTDEFLRDYLNATTRSDLPPVLGVRLAMALVEERDKTKRLETEIKNLRRLSDSQEEAMGMMERGALK